MKPRDRMAAALAIALILFALGKLFWRVQRGIDFTDEAFYLALPMRFALGDRPFVDELNIAQSSGLLIYPLVKLHMLVRGTTGIFWFIRVLYVFLLVAVGASAARLARAKTPLHAALLAGAACIPFLPYGVPALSYNTLGAGFLSLGLFITTRGLFLRGDAPKPWLDPLSWGGFCLGAAAFAYPTLLVSAVAATGAVLVLARHDRLKTALRTIIGGLAFALLVSPALLKAGPSGIKSVLAYSASGMAVTLAKFPMLWAQFLAQHSELATTFGTVAVAIAVSRRFPKSVALLVPVVLLWARQPTATGYMVSLGYVASIALLGPLFAFAIKDQRFGMTVLVGAWLPSAVAGAAVAWTSGNGVIAAGLGLYPAAITTVVLMTAWIFELTRTLPFEELRLVYGFAPLPALWVMSQLALADDAVYRESNLPELTVKVKSGPYKGLYTSPSRDRNLTSTSDGILARATSQRTLFYYDFPAGYLITQTRPLVASVWIFPTAIRGPMDARMFADKATSGDVVFRLGAGLDPMNPLDRAVSERATPDGMHGGFSVYVVR